MTEDAQMKIRLPRVLKANIDRAALGMNRTLNAEIVARLERTFIEDDERISAGGLLIKSESVFLAEAISEGDAQLSRKIEALAERLSVLEEKLG